MSTPVDPAADRAASKVTVLDAALLRQWPMPRRTDGDKFSRGTAVVVGSRDNLVLNECADGRLLAVFGMTDTVMVQTDKITVVAPLGESERIKELVVEVTARLGQSYA